MKNRREAGKKIGIRERISENQPLGKSGALQSDAICVGFFNEDLVVGEGQEGTEDGQGEPQQEEWTQATRCRAKARSLFSNLDSPSGFVLRLI